MNPITIPNIAIPVIGLPTIGIPPVGFPSASGGGLVWPKDLKESIKAIYDPAKQGMTNYDVIESYAEDFSSSSVNGKHGEATVNGQKITVTNVILKERDIVHVSITDDNYYLMLHVSGMTVSNQLRIAMYHNIGGYEYANLNNGINKIYISGVDRRIFIEGNVVGECNITITQLPTSILKDLSGNGNHAYLYGGKGKLNSGMGGYNYVFNNGRNVQDSILNKKYTVYINDTPVNGNLKFKVVTLNPNTIDFSFEIVEKDVDGKVLSYNGMKTPTDIVDFKPRDNTATIQLRIRYDSFATTGDIQLGIQLLPNAYPHQLCYDGKMYAVCYGFPILEDYTVMADRTWFNTEQGVCFLSKSANADGAFIMELREAGSHNAYQTYSFYGKNNINIALNKSGISYQTTRSYNGTDINMGSAKDTNTLFLGTIRKNDRRMFVGCHGKIIIADRSFTEDEITWLKDNWKKI